MLKLLIFGIVVETNLQMAATGNENLSDLLQELSGIKKSRTLWHQIYVITLPVKTVSRKSLDANYPLHQ